MLAQLSAALGALAIGLIGWAGVAAGVATATADSTSVPPGGTAKGPPVAPPGEFLGTLCGFSPLSPVTFSVVAVNGSAAAEGSQVADQTGCVTFDGRVNDGQLSINGSAPAPVGYGLNDVIGTGDNPQNAHVYDTLRVPIVRSGTTGLFAGSQMHIAHIMALVVSCLCGLALLYLLVTFIRHRVSGGMRIPEQRV